MKLKTRVTSLDDVPEAYRDKYTQAEDGKSWTLDEFEFEETTGLKANNERLLKQHKASQEELKALKASLGDLDPQKARDALKKLEELENKSLMDEGKFEELFTKRTESMKRDHEAQVSKMTSSWDADKERIKALEQKLQMTLITSDLRKNATELGIEAGMIPFLELAAEKVWALDEEGKAVWKDNGSVRYGKDGRNPATMNEYLQELISTNPLLLKSSNGNGSHGNTGRGQGVLSISRNDLRDVNKYQAVKEEAAKRGIPMNQVQVTE
jgi:hypothetical protein